MATFTEVKKVLDEIAERTTQNASRTTNAKALLTTAQADLASMPGAYSSILSEIDAGATANPTDQAWQNAKAEKDQMVSDFQALKAEVDALVTAVNS